jgi:hypothetical protein
MSSVTQENSLHFGHNCHFERNLGRLEHLSKGVAITYKLKLFIG